ncbi:hypothetical protein [Erythrobacter oryzae]|uniref:hypothetical protein n=1 Tax=Erythrobacter oryzae TaxID=3019556 RepID=UPI0025529AE7|nr:hypothetical protein [Erythrobacter sp. COR-2]
MRLPKHCLTASRAAERKSGSPSAGPRTVLAFAALLILSACQDMREEVVWSGQTDRGEDKVVACLAGRNVFETVSRIPSQTKGAFPDSRSYFLSRGMILQFDYAARDIDRVFVRADRALTQAEKDELSRCARYPDFPL